MTLYNSPYDTRNSYSFLNRPFNGPVTASLVGHVVFLFFIIFGIPFVVHNPEVLYEPVPVEIVNASDLDKNPEAPTKAPPAPAEVTPPPMKKQAPAMVEDAPPMPEKIEPVIKEVVPEPTPPPPIETPDSEVEEVDTQPPAPLPVRKPKPPPEAVKPKVEEKPKPKNQMSALLKNLTESEPEPVVQNEMADNDNASQAISYGGLNYSEIDAIKAQMLNCWSVRAGTKYAEDLAVKVRLVMNTDRTVRTAKIMDQFRYNSDPAFRSAADAALRAVRNPRCSPLKLPPAKYNEWKTFILNFDPKDML